jgi:hypothetical protein
MMNKSPEPIILAVALFLLALGSAMVAYMFPSVEEITGVKNTGPSEEQARQLKSDVIESSLAIWNSPVLWQEPANHHRLFHSDEYLFYPSAYPNGDYIKRNLPDTRAPSGVPLSWYRKYGLDFTDSNVDREDPDNDGFSNIVEFKNDPVGVRQKATDCDGSKSTNPLDPQDHPLYLARLRLQKYELRPFHIQFKGYQQLNGVYVFQLHLNDVPSYNQPPLKKSGDQLGFEGYTVGAFNQIFKDEVDPNTKITVKTDESTLELDKPEIGLKVIVPFRKEIDSPESTANFVMLMPTEVDKVIKISRGKIFSVPFLTASSFLVIDANDKGATIRDTKTQQQYAIPKLDPAEWDEVPLPPAIAPKSP